MTITFKLGNFRKPDTYIVTAAACGIFTVCGTRSIGEFYFKTGNGRFSNKGNSSFLLHGANIIDFPQEFIDLCIAEAGSFITDPTKINFEYVEDPGHGWLRVPTWLAQELQVKISPYSYMSRDRLTLYLEEDDDMSNFASAFEAKYGTKLNYSKQHDQWGSTRNLPQYDASKLPK